MNRAELQSAVQRYLDFKNLKPGDFDYSLQRTATDNGLLRLPENATVATLTPTGGAAELPHDYRALRSVVGNQNIEAGAMRQVINGAKRYAGPATLYNLDGDQLLVNTSSEAEIELYYWRQELPLGPGANDTTPLLTAYPGLFIHRCVAELALITQDIELGRDHLALYDRTFERLQRQAKQQQGGRGIASVGG